MRMPITAEVIRQLLVIWVLFAPFPIALAHWATEGIKQARQDYRPFPPTRLEFCKGKALAALREAEDWLRQEPSDRQSRLKSRLKWDSLTAEARKPLPSPAVLTELVPRFYTNEPGMEAPELMRLRARLAAFAGAVYYLSLPQLRAEYLARLNLLDVLIEAFGKDIKDYIPRLKPLGVVIDPLEENPEETIRRNISGILSWLEGAELGERLVADVRRHFGNPNFHVTVSQRFFSLTFPTDTELNDEQDEPRTIAGAPVTGKITTHATLRVKVAPNPFYADVVLVMEGEAVGEDNVSMRDELEVHSSSRITLYGEKIIRIGHGGLRRYLAKTEAETVIDLNEFKADGAQVPWLKALGARAKMKRSELKAQAEEESSALAANSFRELINRQPPLPLPFLTDYPRRFRTPMDRVGTCRRWNSHLLKRL